MKKPWILRFPTVPIVDQLLSSASNFLVSFLGARYLAPAVFGRYSVALVLVFLSLALARAVIGEPTQVEIGRGVRDLKLVGLHHARAFAVVNFACTVGLISGALLVPDAATFLLVAAIGCPFVLFQDSLRHVAFAVGLPKVAAISDLSWLVLQFAVVGVGLLTGQIHQGALLLGGWFSGAALAAAIGAWYLRPFVRGLISWRSRSTQMGSLGKWLGGTVFLGEAVNRGLGLVAAGIVGMSGYGLLRSVDVMFSPLSTLARGVRIWLLPRMVPRIRKHSVVSRGFWLLLGTGGALIGLMIWQADRIASFAFSGQYRGIHGVALFIGLSLFFQTAGMVAGLGLRALGDGRGVFTIYLVGTLVTTPFLIYFSARWGPLGAAAGIASQSGVATIWSWMRLIWKLRVGIDDRIMEDSLDVSISID